MSKIYSDIEIAEKNKPQNIETVARKIKIPAKSLHMYGKYAAKIDFSFIKKATRKSGKLILVTAINPTPAGEGKTTTSIGLHDALCLKKKKSLLCLREPSMGPVFGLKGGATGGGKAQIVPMTVINLHFTGDIHAITAANNLLAAMIDNHIYFGNRLRIDQNRITWQRALDVNDRALRSVEAGGRKDSFNITAASEIMSVFCLATDFDDLIKRLDRIIVAYNIDGDPVYAKDLNASGAMSVLLRDALMPNIVQTLEHNPVLVHGGPFANIAHGCNSVIATKAALHMADYIITEAGFGADLGAEKFLDIKCRSAGLHPDMVILVATVRALKMNGGVSKENLATENMNALAAGIVNLERHINNLKQYGLPLIVALNRFATDSKKEIAFVTRFCADRGVPAVLCDHWAKGGKGATKLADAVLETLSRNKASFKFLYPAKMPLPDKIKKIATSIYHAGKVEFSETAIAKLKQMARDGKNSYPVCIAKTQYSFSADPDLLGAPEGHTLHVRDVYLSNGSGFVVAICGSIMTMPGLPKTPAAENIHIGKDGKIKGIF